MGVDVKVVASAILNLLYTNYFISAVKRFIGPHMYCKVYLTPYTKNELKTQTKQS